MTYTPAPARMDDDLLATVSKVRIAMIQSQVREKTGYFEQPTHRRRRSTITAVTYAGTKDGVPVFTKQKVTKVV